MVYGLWFMVYGIRRRTLLRNDLRSQCTHSHYIRQRPFCLTHTDTHMFTHTMFPTSSGTILIRCFGVSVLCCCCVVGVFGVLGVSTYHPLLPSSPSVQERQARGGGGRGGGGGSDVFPVPSTEPLPPGYHSYAIVHGEENMDLTEYVNRLCSTVLLAICERGRERGSDTHTCYTCFPPLLMNLNLCVPFLSQASLYPFQPLA